MIISDNLIIEEIEKPVAMTDNSDLQEIVLKLSTKHPYELMPKLEQQFLDYALDIAFRLYNKESDLPLNKAVVSVLSELTTEIPPKTILKVVQQTIEEWENWKAVDSLIIKKAA